MSLHIEASPEQVAPVVLLPGDPLRAQWIAETFLENPLCYNRVRHMLGFTGTYKGRRISVQGTGMGAPSMSIYAHELIQHYGAKSLLRVGTCGALQREVRVRQLVLAAAACTDAGTNLLRFQGMSFAPTADFSLLHQAFHLAVKAGSEVRVGCVASSDRFYDDSASWKHWAAHGVLAIEMETAELYTVCAAHNVAALAILTVSDHVIEGTSTPAHEREREFAAAAQLALDLAKENPATPKGAPS